MTAAQKLRLIVRSAKGDDLERANSQFSSWSDAALDQPYGQSGKTAREVWQECRDERNDWHAAYGLLESLLKEQK
jgi:hypothetical protein